MVAYMTGVTVLHFVEGFTALWQGTSSSYQWGFFHIKYREKAQ